MPKTNLRKALVTEKIEKFGGICHEASKLGEKRENGSYNAADIRNFRILPCGYLEKREGVSYLFSFSEAPRAFWRGYLDGAESSVAIIGRSVYKVIFPSGRLLDMGSIGTEDRPVKIFCYRGELYILDTTEIYRVKAGNTTPVVGYVPLYGKNWSGDYGDKINEPINCLSNRIRIHYSLSEDRNTFNIGVKCSEIVYFRSNGVDMTEKVSLTEDGLGIVCNDCLIAANSEIDVCLVLDIRVTRRNEIVRNQKATVYGGERDGRIILYKGPDLSKMYISREVTNEDMEASLIADENSTDIYFPVSDTFTVSDGRYAITTICRHYDRLLIFTRGETYMADFTVNSASPYIVPINSGVGCVSENGAVLGGNSPFTVSEGGIYLWTSDSDERNECNAVCISGEIGDMLDESFYQKAISFYFRSRDEVWFADPYSENQDVWIYSVSGQNWYRFDGIPVDKFFLYNNQVSMLYGKYVFTLSEKAFLDSSAENAVKEPIEAYYESNNIDFGMPERTKHMGRIMLESDCDGDTFNVIIYGDRGGIKVFHVNEDSEDPEKYSTYFDAKGGIGRFKEMNFKITTNSVGRTRIKALSLTALK